MTIGDFWGVENVVPCFNDNKGASLIFVNSEMGNEILEAIKSDIILYEVPVDLCKQHNLEKPTKRNPKSNLFWKNYHKSGLEKAYTKATRRSLISVIKKIVKKLSKNY